MSIRRKRFAVIGALLIALSASAAGADKESAALHSALAIERARALAPRIEREAFLVGAAISKAVLSPDGRHLAYLHEQGKQTGIWLLSTQDDTRQRLLPQTKASALYWSHDSAWLMLESAREVFALSIDGKASAIVTTLAGNDRREMISADPLQPAALLISEHNAATATQSERWRLLRVDMQGKRTLLHEDRRQIAGFSFARDGRLAFLAHVQDRDIVIEQRDDAGHLVERVRCRNLHRCQLLPVVAADDALLLRSDIGSSRSALMRMDDHGEMHVLQHDPNDQADLDSLLLDPLDAQPLIASYRSTVAHNLGLDADSARHVTAIAKQFPQRDIDIQVGRGDDAFWLLAERASTLQIQRWHLYDPRSGAIRRILDEPPLPMRNQHDASWLAEASLARKIPITWAASDGMRLYGFLLVPPGTDPAKLPLVANVHGGPWSFARPDYTATSQLLVNRGYAVFEPNFRGSTGFGRDYVFAAAGDYGNGRVQQDIVEGVRHLLAQGIGDQDRVGIIGASFGGYSSLLGVTFSPGLFKVGIAIVPPTDLAWDLRWVGRSSEALSLSRYIPFEDWLSMLSLDPNDAIAMAKLHAQSPLANVERLQRPLLLIAGGADRRVPIRGIVEYAAKLKLHSKPVDLYIDDEAGHAVSSALARDAMMYLIEDMLHRHLGGAAATPVDAGVREQLRLMLRIDEQNRSS